MKSRLHRAVSIERENMSTHGNKNNTMRKDRQQGGTLLGIIIGLIIGLTIAVIVALAITKTSLPFTNKSGAQPKTLCGSHGSHSIMCQRAFRTKFGDSLRWFRFRPPSSLEHRHWL